MNKIFDGEEVDIYHHFITPFEADGALKRIRDFDTHVKYSANAKDIEEVTLWRELPMPFIFQREFYFQV